MTSKFKKFAAAILLFIVGILCGATVTLVVKPAEDGTTEIAIEATYQMELAIDQDVPALVENEEGKITEENLPVVESIDDGQALVEEGDMPDLGQGAYYDVSSPQAFAAATLGKCIDMDGYWGSQCVDLAAAFFSSYANRWPSVCGTGAARGLWDCREQNAGDEFVLITDPAQLQPGDIAVFGGGQSGHVGVTMGPYNNGYVALLGENQGGANCPNGGAAVNVINMSTSTFLGAFRPKAYIAPEPEPTPEPILPVSNCVQWHLEQSDTLGKIMLECENTIQYGEAMDAYAKTWYSLYYAPGQSVYDGWYRSSNGVGLYAGDDIEHRIGEQQQ